MTERTLHVSLGPVQGFVAEARRTRDLWAGSFLLSWLSGQLMAFVLKKGGSIQFPAVGTKQEPEDDMLAAILGRPRPGAPPPQIGTLPNRFKAQVPKSFDPDEMAKVTRRKWCTLAELVWQRFVEKVADNGQSTHTIWVRQIEGFWDIQWLMGDNPKTGSDMRWLDIRKNWRSHWPPQEAGDHCTMMGDWQELSGYVRSRERKEQDGFWKALQRDTGRLDLRDDERLCAIALVKRLFPKLKKEEQEQAIGWRVDTVHWPSTAYMAAVPWLAHIAADKERVVALHEYVKTVRDHVGKATFSKLSGERATRLPALAPLGQAANLDGNLFLEAALENPKATPLNNDQAAKGNDPDADQRKQLLRALQNLGEKKVGGPAHPFYALLLMDGDRLGGLLHKQDGKTVSEALACFTGCVGETVRKHDGVTVYAGGDDVLAVLPAHRAIECTLSLRLAYGKAFSQRKVEATASAAIAFAHYGNPLREVLSLAREALEKTAKEKNGRDSLALEVMLPGGVNHNWVARFGKVTEALIRLRDRIAGDAHRYSSSFFYHLRERYGALLDELETDDQRAIILAEYVKGSPPKGAEERKQAEEFAAVMLSACSTQRGDGKDAGHSLQLAGAFIARFLAERSHFG